MATALQTQIENWRLRLAVSPFGQFLRWWGAELREMLPKGIKAHMSHAQGRVVARLGPDGLELGWFEAGELQILDAFGPDQDVRVQRQQISDLLHERELDESPRDLLLPADDVLFKTVSLPLAAESNLRQALAYEMDRNTPFRAGDVYFDYRVLDRDREKSQLRAEMVVTPRAAVDGQIETLEARGLAPSGLDVERDGRPAGLNLLPLDRRHRSVNRRTRINLLLGVVVLLLLAGVMMQSLWLREQQTDRVNEAIEDVRVEARRVQNIRSEIEDATEAAGFMIGRRMETTPSVKVLAEATRLMPDDTYLDRFRVWDGKVQFQGKSDNAQRLIEIVNNSPMFDDAAFTGSTRLDPRSGKEQFNIRAVLVSGPPSAQLADAGGEGG